MGLTVEWLLPGNFIFSGYRDRMIEYRLILLNQAPTNAPGVIAQGDIYGNPF